jgi:hypothetical protein
MRDTRALERVTAADQRNKPDQANWVNPGQQQYSLTSLIAHRIHTTNLPPFLQKLRTSSQPTLAKDVIPSTSHPLPKSGLIYTSADCTKPLPLCFAFKRVGGAETEMVESHQEFVFLILSVIRCVMSGFRRAAEIREEKNKLLSQALLSKKKVSKRTRISNQPSSSGLACCLP